MKALLSMTLISKPGLELIPATKAHMEMELNLPSMLSGALDAEVPSDWPPGEYDRDAMQFFHDRLSEGGDQVSEWYSWYAIRCSDDGGRVLVGAAGFFGPPINSIAEIGYSVMEKWQGQGLASEVVALLAEHAAAKGVHTLRARTFETNKASIKVLLKNGFNTTGETDEGATVFTKVL
jgi:ribosomal-protein-alanine N-acetyltransferase